MLFPSDDTGDIDLIPLDWYILMLENGLDGLRNFRTNAITCRRLVSPKVAPRERLALKYLEST